MTTKNNSYISILKQAILDSVMVTSIYMIIMTVLSFNRSVAHYVGWFLGCFIYTVIRDFYRLRKRNNDVAD